ncbi:MAG: hypothetical protein JWP40_4752 [Blastococcus sp.]|jgi:hypothetical protein|nr:hypothetical protein [Blastococcus sp.]
MQMTVRIPGSRRVMPHGHGLQPLNRDFDLPARRAHPGGGVLAEPAQNLGGGAVLRRVIRGGNVRVQRRGQRPGLRPVHNHFYEPNRPVIGPQPPPRLAGPGVEAGDPGLVVLAGQRCQLHHRATGADGEAPRDPGALGQVVVIRPPRSAAR